MGWYADTATLRFVVRDNGTFKATAISFSRGDEVEADCRVGDAQDSESSHSAYVVLDQGDWSAPANDGGVLNREIRSRGGANTSGSIAMNLYTLYPQVTYRLEVTYQAARQPVDLEVWHGGVLRRHFELPVTTDGFQKTLFDLHDLDRGTLRDAPIVGEPTASTPFETGAGAAAAPTEAEQPGAHLDGEPTRWPGEGSLLIESVVLIGKDGHEQAVYQPGDTMRVVVHVRAARAGAFPVTPAAVLYRVDGVKVFSRIGDPFTVSLTAHEGFHVELDLGPLNLGDGHYAFALAMYQILHPVGQSKWYDLIDRDYRFEVVGASAFTGLFEHPGRWKLRSQ
jgi:hypothetical protein